MCSAKKNDTKLYRERLLALRARLRGDVLQMADATLKKNRTEANGDLSSMPIHMADIGSDNFDRDFTLSLIETDGATLENIESALERLEDGSVRHVRRVRAEDSQDAAGCHSIHDHVRQVRFPI